MLASRREESTTTHKDLTLCQGISGLEMDLGESVESNDSTQPCQHVTYRPTEKSGSETPTHCSSIS